MTISSSASSRRRLVHGLFTVAAFAVSPLIAPTGADAQIPYREAVSRDGLDVDPVLFVREEIQKNQYTIDRGIKEYEFYFGPPLMEELEKLDADMHWVDGGAGNAYAQKDYLGSRTGEVIKPRRARLTAITYVYPENEPKELADGRFKVLAGRYFEEIPNSEIPAADLITDMTGVINYTYQLDLVLKKYLDLLKTDGKIFVYIPMHITKITKKTGVIYGLMEWLKRIPGLTVTPIEGPHAGSAFIITKSACNIEVPKLRLRYARRQWALFREFEEI